MNWKDLVPNCILLTGSAEYKLLPDGIRLTEDGVIFLVMDQNNFVQEINANEVIMIRPPVVESPYSIDDEEV